MLSIPVRHDVSLETKLILQQLVHDSSVLAGIGAIDFVVATPN